MSKLLYLGLNPTHFQTEKNLVHLPIIQIVPRDYNRLEIKDKFQDLSAYTHIIFTSKSAVKCFSQCLEHFQMQLDKQQLVAIGSRTAEKIKEFGMLPTWVAKKATQEGIMELFLDVEEAYIFMPRSSLARSALVDFFKGRGVRTQTCDLYDTHFLIPKQPPDLKNFDEIVFTSPSTVESFLKIYKKFPTHAKLTSIGPITKAKLGEH